MNILITCFTYEPQLNGVQFVTKYLCEGLSDRGHRVVLCTHSDQLFCKDRINGVEVRRWPFSTKYTLHFGPKKDFVEYVFETQTDFDVMINVGTQTAMTDTLLPYLGKIDLPKVLHLHSVWDFKFHKWDFETPTAFIRKAWANLRWAVYYKINSSRFRQYNSVFQLYQQDYSVEFFKRKYGIRSLILENAADDAFHQELLPISERNHTIVCVANYARQKNQPMLIEAFLKSNISSGWKLILIGSEKNQYYFQACQRVAELRSALALEPNEKPIEMLTNISREEVYETVKNASIYAMSSIWEAFPISILEAMSAGLPWVSTDVGIVHWLPGGKIVDSVESMSSQLEEFSNNPAYRESLSSDAFKYAEDHFRIIDKVDILEKELIRLTSGERITN